MWALLIFCNFPNNLLCVEKVNNCSLNRDNIFLKLRLDSYLLLSANSTPNRTTS